MRSPKEVTLPGCSSKSSPSSFSTSTWKQKTTEACPPSGRKEPAAHILTYLYVRIHINIYICMYVGMYIYIYIYVSEIHKKYIIQGFFATMASSCSRAMHRRSAAAWLALGLVMPCRHQATTKTELQAPSKYVCMYVQEYVTHTKQSMNIYLYIYIYTLID